jgi:hypothetical protein
MRYRTRNLDTEQSRDAEQKTKDSGHKATPHKEGAIPILCL